MPDMMMFDWNLSLLAQPGFPGAASPWEYILIKNYREREKYRRKAVFKKCVYQLYKKIYLKQANTYSGTCSRELPVGSDFSG